MIIVMRMGASEAEVGAVTRQIQELGFRAHLSRGEERTIIGLIGDERNVSQQSLELLSGVERVIPVLHPFKLASRDFRPEDSVVSVGSVKVGGRRVTIMAGPCAVESRQQLLETAWAVKEAGASVLRGGAFKPRTSPYAFPGLGEAGLELLAEAREETGLPIVSEVMAPETVGLVSGYADMVQIGTRNMQNYALLHAVGEAGCPVLLKRGLMSTMEEFLMAAEYVLSHGNFHVILCERGIRTFETYTRNTLDINAVPMLKMLTHLPVMVDPSHGTGRWDLVEPVSRASVAAGADGLMVEVHPHPAQALSDGAQSLKPENFAALVRSVSAIAAVLDREV
ncbi:MAG: 3-deoxy-7-phosphoheptulonate synthase [Anaerolineae bacterium]|nr:3-deoxy-7-phosphoheptulonate synthase [Anaerolineae bacterium]